MSKQPHYTLIGAFVIGAIALGVGMVIVFGSGALLTESVKYVAYFNGSVKGLRLGAPVNFRGARVGTVTDVKLVYQDTTETIYIPVVIEIEKGGIASAEDMKRRVNLTTDEHHEIMQRFAEQRGLRAQLALESFVTGQLLVELDFMPNTPLVRVNLPSPYPEIPTVPSSFEKLSRVLEEVPLDEIAYDLRNALKAIGELVDSPETRESLRSLSRMLQRSDALLGMLQDQVPALTSDFAKTLEEARDTLRATRGAVKTYEGLVNQGSPNGSELMRTVREIRAAAESLKLLTDFMERNPESILRGKARP